MIKQFFKFSILLATGYWLLATPFTFAEEINFGAVADKKTQLEQELKKIEEQINTYRGVIQEKQKQSTTLERDIAIFSAKIEKIKLEIKARDMRISQLSEGIGQRATTIGTLTEKMGKEKDSLGELLRRTNEMDSASLVEIVLGKDDLSDFFSEEQSFESIQQSIQNSVVEIKGTKEQTEKEKADLEDKKTEQVELRGIQDMERKKLAGSEAEKKKILKTTKGEESKYQKIINERQKDAASIRSQLFLLTGSPSIPFEKAVEYATSAWRATGVRPAFLLGVITEESNLGANVGKGNWKEDLSNSRCEKQRTAFMEICSELGLNPDMMPVSKRAWYGYCGGAMGPAQFMPTTWQLYRKKISTITGNNPPSPWDPKDAFVASSLLLKDNGAVANNSNSERKAALKYLAGSKWSNPSYSFYGDDVMEFAAKYQSMIDILNK